MIVNNGKRNIVTMATLQWLNDRFEYEINGWH
jgi:hypothetical protein